MLQKIKNNVFQKRAQQYLSSNTRERRFVSYEKAKTVLLLFESDVMEKNPVIRKIIKLLQQDGKKVVAWGFSDKKEITTPILRDYRILNCKHTNFFHQPLPEFMNELATLEFDLLIDLSLKPILTLQYLALYTNAFCKTGKRNTHLPIYDFVLDLENVSTSTESTELTENIVDEMYLFNQIIFYLKRIQTND